MYLAMFVVVVAIVRKLYKFTIAVKILPKY